MRVHRTGGHAVAAGVDAVARQLHQSGDILVNNYILGLAVELAGKDNCCYHNTTPETMVRESRLWRIVKFKFVKNKRENIGLFLIINMAVTPQ